MRKSIFFKKKLFNLNKVIKTPLKKNYKISSNKKNYYKDKIKFKEILEINKKIINNIHNKLDLNWENEIKKSKKVYLKNKNNSISSNFNSMIKNSKKIEYKLKIKKQKNMSHDFNINFLIKFNKNDLINKVYR